MDHNDIRHKLSEYIDGSVTADEKSSIEEHLKTCTSCSNALHELEKTVEHIKTIEEVEPPAWMTQKIMANVRAEVEGKKGLFRRLFHPLSVKLPVQAVAVVFLAVTAYYLYQNINPADRYAQAPVEKAETEKQTAPMLSPPPEPRIQQEPAPAVKTPQAPEYKALDMKYEYEKPAPPTPLGKAAAPQSVPAPPTAPAPAKRSEQPRPGDEAIEGKAPERAPASESAGYADRLQKESGVGLMAKKPAPSPHAKTMTAVEEIKRIRLSLAAPDASKAAQDIEKIVTRLGGRIVEKTGEADALMVILSVDAGRIKELDTRLRSVGELKGKEMLSLDYRGITIIEIAIHTIPPQP